MVEFYKKKFPGVLPVLIVLLRLLLEGDLLRGNHQVPSARCLLLRQYPRTRLLFLHHTQEVSCFTTFPGRGCSPIVKNLQNSKIFNINLKTENIELSYKQKPIGAAKSNPEKLGTLVL